MSRLNPYVSRRTVLKAGAAATAALAIPPYFWRHVAWGASAGPEQVHLQFGNDAAREMTVSWTTSGAVSNPRVNVGPVSGTYDQSVPAETLTYVDSISGTETWAYHARITGLQPNTQYAYQATFDNATPVTSAFTTAPVGRSAFRFTSFGDQCTGTTGDALATPQGSWVVAQLEALNPLFHTINGDLSYANTESSARVDRAGVWNNWFTNAQRSAMNRPWMPALGNHECESGNGAQGTLAYLTRFGLPSNGTSDFAHNWYAFTAGAVRFISVDTNDVVYSTDFDFSIYGYNGTEQLTWLETELASSRANPAIDWIVVFMHYPVMSTAGGSDLGLRQTYAPLVDQYGVDLVLTGHSHDYERMYAVKGVVGGSSTLEPQVASTATTAIDTTQGAVHMVVGTGGVAIPTPTYGGTPASPTASVTVQGGGTTSEPAPYSAVRDLQSPYGFLSVDVDPGTGPGALTTMTLNFWHTMPGGVTAPSAFDSFTIQRPRSDGPSASLPEGAPLILTAGAAVAAGAIALHRSRRPPVAAGTD